ncbi:MAG: hypothetical protein R3E12_19020 [Candidatus Eisenbacteria bacterium]
MVDAGDLVYPDWRAAGGSVHWPAVARTSARSARAAGARFFDPQSRLRLARIQYIADAVVRPGSSPVPTLAYQITDAPEPGDYSVVASADLRSRARRLA